MGTTCSSNQSIDDMDFTISEIDLDEYDNDLASTSRHSAAQALDDSDLLLEFDEEDASRGSVSFDKGILRTVLAGNIQDFPDIGIPKGCLSIYISSTGYDSVFERHILMNKILPKLREKGNQFGIHVSFCDMYSMNDFHVVPNDLSDDGRSPAVPFSQLGAISPFTISSSAWHARKTEIQRCHEISGGIFFLSLLGDNYGFQPLPKYLDQETFEKVLSMQKIKKKLASKTDARTEKSFLGKSRSDDNSTKSTNTNTYTNNRGPIVRESNGLLIEVDEESAMSESALSNNHHQQELKMKKSFGSSFYQKLVINTVGSSNSNRNNNNSYFRSHRTNRRKLLQDAKFKKALLLKWYRLDENQCPPRYELRELPPVPSSMKSNSSSSNEFDGDGDQQRDGNQSGLPENKKRDGSANSRSVGIQGKREEVENENFRQNRISREFWYKTYPILLKILQDVTFDGVYQVGHSYVEYESLCAMKLDSSRCHWIHRRFDWRGITFDEYERNHILNALSDSYMHGSDDRLNLRPQQNELKKYNNPLKLRRLQRTLKSKLMECSIEELPIIDPLVFLSAFDRNDPIGDDGLLWLQHDASEHKQPSSLLLPDRQKEQQDREERLECFIRYLESWEEVAANVLTNELNQIIKLKCSWDRDGLGLGIAGREIEEMMLHAKITHEKSTTFVGRDSLIETALTLIGQANREGDDSFGGICCMIVGKSGSGKTSFMAKLAQILTSKDNIYYHLLIARTGSPGINRLDSQDVGNTVVDVPVIVRYCGKSEYSKDPAKLLSSIILQIYLVYHDGFNVKQKLMRKKNQNQNNASSNNLAASQTTEDTAIATFLQTYQSQSYEDIVNIFHHVLCRYPVVLFLDSLHHLATTDDIPNRLAFLAGIKPHKQSRIIVSTYPDEYVMVNDSFTALANSNNKLQTKSDQSRSLAQRQWVTYYMIESKLRAAKVPKVPVKGLETKNDDSTNSTRFFVDLLLKTKGRIITSKQLDNLLHKISKEPTALYVKLAVNIAATWRSFDTGSNEDDNEASQRALLGTITPRILSLKPYNARIIAQIFKTLEDCFGKKLVGYALGYITIAREGKFVAVIIS